ncbi:TPA: hypothetical protein JZ983_004812, partial [Escherichia coli]|nr:hypothetical protein [Escherichia coli]
MATVTIHCPRCDSD